MQQFSNGNYRLLLILIVALATFGLQAQRESAAVIHVDASCSLHDAIVAANTDVASGGCPAGEGADTVILSGDVTLSEALPPITSTITIEGDGLSISGDGKFRIFEVDGGSLTIEKLSLADGKSVSDELGDRGGGAIHAKDGTVVINNSNFRNNVTKHYGGAIQLWDANLTISDSSFSGNRAERQGGAIFAFDSRIKIAKSSFTYNRASWGGAINSHGNFGGSSWTINNSTFSRNVATGEGGAISMQGGVRVIMNHVTVAYNSAPTGGGIYNRRGKLHVTNSIITENSPNDCPHMTELNIGNLIQRGNCDQARRADPLLLPLTGSPAFHPLQDYSPAINGASAEHCLETDQAGNPRPVPAGEACDIGAVESASGIEARPIPAPTICTLEDQIIAANTDASSGACPAGNGHDTVELTEDVILPVQLPPVTSQITIEGRGRTLSGDNHYQVFQVDGGDLTLNDLTIKQGYGVDGGAIGVTNGGALTVNNSVICENASELDGGAIHADQASSVEINSSVICDNVSHRDIGGGIVVWRESSLTVQDSRITGNSTRLEGGAIYMRESDASITGSVISGNGAGIGGAIHSRGPAHLTIDRSSIYDNTSHHRAGAISVWDSVLAIQNSTISNNRATRLSWEEGYSSGGGISSSDSSVSLLHITLAHNRAGDGGGLDMSGGSLDMRNSIIAHNGGGDCSLGTTVTLIMFSGNFFGDGTCESNSTRSAHLLPLTHSKPYHALKPESPAINAADPDHCLLVDQLGNARPAGEGCDIGAIESAHEVAIEPPPATHCTLADQILAANRDQPVGACPAGESADTIVIQTDITLDCTLPPITSEISIEGNGFSISGDKRFQIFYVIGGKLTVNNLTLKDGASYAGGAIRARRGGELSIRNSILRGNSAVAGGAIMVHDGKLTIHGSSFHDNRSEYQGGAIHVYQSEARIFRSAIKRNKAARSGGGVYFASSVAELKNITISGNSADMWGGAIHGFGGDIDLVHVTIVNNSAPEFGGIAGNRADFDLYNSIVANNSGGDCDGSSEYGPWVSSWSTLIGDQSCEAAYSGDPMLHALDEASGVQHLRDGSPAIDAADPEYCPETDQLGNARPQGAGCDIGAVEYVGE